MKNREKTGKAFRIKWLLLALVAAALIFVPAASHKVSAAKLVYTVKFNNNSGTSKSKTYTALTRNVTLNTTIKLPAVPKAVGYQNLGWTTRKGSSKVVYKAGASVKVRKDMTLYAVRRKSKYYTVNFYLGNGSTNSAYKKLQKKVEEGTYYTLPAVPSRSGYVNLGWSIAKNGKASTAKKVGTKIKISGNIRYYSVQMQSVKVNLRKANGTVWKTVTLGKGGYLKLPSVSNATGYTFMGWSKTRRTGSSTDPDYEAGELLRPRRQSPALLDGADARPAGPDRRMPRSDTLHAVRPRRADRTRNSLCGRPLRRGPRLRPRRGAGRGRHGLRNGEHSARRQDFRSRQPLRHQSQTAGRRSRRRRGPARGAFGGAGAGRRRRAARIRRRRPALAGRTR